MNVLTRPRILREYGGASRGHLRRAMGRMLHAATWSSAVGAAPGLSSANSAARSAAGGDVDHTEISEIFFVSRRDDSLVRARAAFSSLGANNRTAKLTSQAEVRQWVEDTAEFYSTLRPGRLDHSCDSSCGRKPTSGYKDRETAER